MDTRGPRPDGNLDSMSKLYIPQLTYWETEVILAIFSSRTVRSCHFDRID